MGIESIYDGNRPSGAGRRVLVAALAGIVNLSGLLVARYGLLQELAPCAALPDGCEGQAAMGPLVRAFGVAVVVGAMAVWLVALATATFGKMETGVPIRRLSGALVVYVVLIVLSAIGLFFVPFGLYVLFALFLIGPPVAVFSTIRW